MIIFVLKSFKRAKSDKFIIRRNVIEILRFYFNYNLRHQVPTLHFLYLIYTKLHEISQFTVRLLSVLLYGFSGLIKFVSFAWYFYVMERVSTYLCESRQVDKREQGGAGGEFLQDFGLCKEEERARERHQLHHSHSHIVKNVKTM